MLETFTKGCKKTFSTIVKVMGLSLVCTAIGAGLVLPLWKWASASPFSYSVAATIAFGAVLFFVLLKSLKKAGPAKFFTRFAKVIVLAGGILGCIALVMHGKRILSLVVLIASVSLYTLISTLASGKEAAKGRQ